MSHKKLCPICKNPLYVHRQSYTNARQWVEYSCSECGHTEKLFEGISISKAFYSLMNSLSGIYTRRLAGALVLLGTKPELAETLRLRCPVCFEMFKVKHGIDYRPLDPDRGFLSGEIVTGLFCPNCYSDLAEVHTKWSER